MNNEGLSEIIGPFPFRHLEISGNATAIRDRTEDATGTQYIHPITRFPSVIVIGGESTILTTLTLGQPEVMQTFARLGPAQRAGLLLALRTACKALFEGRTCELCDRTALKVRFVLVPPDGDFGPAKRPGVGEALGVFSVLCNGCVQIPAPDRDRKVLEEFARVQKLRGKSVPRRRPAIIGQRVGTQPQLASRSALQSCERCGESIWFDQDHLDRDCEPGLEVFFVCRDCAEQLFQTGGLESIPWQLVASRGRGSA